MSIDPTTDLGDYPALRRMWDFAAEAKSEGAPVDLVCAVARDAWEGASGQTLLPDDPSRPWAGLGNTDLADSLAAIAWQSAEVTAVSHSTSAVSITLEVLSDAVRRARDGDED